jgi:hypothetical protein
VDESTEGVGDVARIDEVGDSLYRISVFVPEGHLSFNQFPAEDERPALIGG